MTYHKQPSRQLLATLHGQELTTRELAQAINRTPNATLNILNRLAAANLVQAKRIPYGPMDRPTRLWRCTEDT